MVKCHILDTPSKDLRWKNVRNYLIDSSVLGPDLFSMVTGILIVLMCPLMIVLQSLIFAVALNLSTMAKENFKKIMNRVAACL